MNIKEQILAGAKDFKKTNGKWPTKVLLTSDDEIELEKLSVIQVGNKTVGRPDKLLGYVPVWDQKTFGFE